MSSKKETILVVGDLEAGNISQILSDEKLKNEILPVAEAKLHVKDPLDLALFCFKKETLEENINLISEFRKAQDSLPIFVISDNENWNLAVQSLKAGANDYFPYPFEKEKLIDKVRDQVKVYHLTKKVFFMGADLLIPSPFEGMVGVSEKMQENFRMIQAVAKSNATVLITGESGTGKELVAKAIHHRSARNQYRFVDLNCGAIPRDLLENELFGHEKGAFTGAHKRYMGSFEAAHRGTLFLDEISEMDPLLQVKLLRVLQERSFTRIGGTEKIDVDVRIIAATNRNLEDTIAKGQFREDLYYRLNVVNVPLPALRDRREDIPLMATHFLEYYNAKNDKIFVDFATEALEALLNYDWPGNVRELENTVERIVVLNDDSQVKIKHLPKHFHRVGRSISLQEVAKAVPSEEEQKIIALDELEKRAIETALVYYHGNVAVAAKKLKIGQATLYRKLKAYGIPH